ncbi:MTRF1L release factor glutamine methyltransferase isoform X2 [Pipistrellus kuhlii]|uniref:MTRF1L release factor glutamine methyltransferase isoform X2 n=1 Tax=Pipistrellus kuhlii TaxID=59472 RepID=UPI001E271EFC|nr:MTRF1L release factor glutamine methyltransferase isoform X2 [Pipistrellus kuhlii]
MELWGAVLRALLTGPGRRGGTLGRAFSSRRPRLPQAGRSAIELVSQWAAVFEKRGVPEPRESSEYIVAHVLGAKTFQSLRPALRSKPLTPWQLRCVQELSRRRLQRMPVQYILGEWDFHGLSLKMAPPVFIPRPETEELVEWVLEEEAQKPRAGGARGGPLILEVGCGSGAISLSLLSQLPQSRVLAVDKAGAAVSLALENAQRLQLQDRIRITALDVTLEGSWTHLLPWGPVDLLVSNPPYVFRQDMALLAPEICRSLFLEVDPRHPELVGSWLRSRPGLALELAAVRRDCCGRPRFLHIRRSGPQGGCPVDAGPAPQPAGGPG